MKLCVFLFLFLSFIFSEEVKAQVKTKHQIDLSNCAQKAAEETDQLTKKLGSSKLSLSEIQKDSVLAIYKDFYCQVASLNSSKERMPDRSTLITELNTSRNKRLSLALTPDQYKLYNNESERTKQKFQEQMKNRIKTKS